MITINNSREPVETNLAGGFATVGLTLRRMTSADFGEAQAATLALLADSARLDAMMTANDLMPDGGAAAWRALPTSDPEVYCAAMAGLGEWIAAVECATRAITAWRGLLTEQGLAVDLSREALESAMLNAEFATQVRTAIDEAAALIVQTSASETNQ